MSDAKGRKAAGRGRSICLDAYGTDSTGKKYDLEIQREDRGAEPHRTRYHSSVMDIENLNAGEDFNALLDTYTIFITEKGFFGMGTPVYQIERINLATGKPFEDGEHILYVNGEYRDDSDIGKLLHDFNCTDADDINFELMAQRTRYLKETPKGVSEMCKVIEEMRKETADRVLLQTMRNIMDTLKLTAEQALDAMKISDADREKYLERL